MKKGKQSKTAKKEEHGKLFSTLLIITFLLQAFLVFQTRNTIPSLLLNILISLAVLGGLWFRKKVALYVFFIFLLILSTSYLPMILLQFISQLIFAPTDFGSVISYLPALLSIIFVGLWFVAIKSEWHRFDTHDEKNNTVNAIVTATGLIYVLSYILFLVQMYVLFYFVYAKYPAMAEMYQLQFSDLTTELIGELMTASSYSGMISGIYFVLLTLVYVYAGWLVVKKSKSNLWYQAAFPSLIVFAAGLLYELPSLQYNFLAQILSRPYDLSWTPYLFIIPILASLAGGLLARHIILRIK